MEEAAVIAWLEQIRKLDELIKAEIADIMAQATKITASLDGMPHGGGVSDKVGDGAVRLADSEELNKLKQQRQYIINTIKLLPAKEFGVLHREYVQNMTQRQIADDMYYTTVTVWRIKKEALRLLGDILQKKGDRPI